ncbi:MAG: hypothetical protein OZ921_10035 [Sorangiineae bacterium]|nr:hypothetical protein [Sorangiineae bacterium]
MGTPPGREIDDPLTLAGARAAAPLTCREIDGAEPARAADLMRDHVST